MLSASLWNGFLTFPPQIREHEIYAEEKEIWPRSFSSPQLLPFFLCIAPSALISNFPYHFIAPFPSYTLLATYCMWDKRVNSRKLSLSLSDCSLLYTPLGAWSVEEVGKKRDTEGTEEQTAGCDSESRRSDSGTSTGFMLCCVVWALWDQACKIPLDTLLTGLYSTRLCFMWK